MRLKIILATITAFVCGAQAIVGGIAASNEDLPFIVSVARTSHQCSGVLISPSAVLTDPECVEQGRVTSLKVRAGTRRHASGGVLEQVSKIDIHQDYVSGTPKGRIAILHLAAAVPASSGDRKIQEAPLPSQETSSGTKLVNEAGQVVGLIQSPYRGCAQAGYFSIATNLVEYESWIAERVLDLPQQRAKL
jgi:secreted trypsin-like serine protease